MDIKQTLMQALKRDVKIDLERKLEKVRVPCINYPTLKGVGLPTS